MDLNCRSFQKLLFAYVPPNSCSYKFRRIDRKTPVSKSFFNKVAELMPTTSLKKGLRHKCFSEGFAKFSRAVFLIEPPVAASVYLPRKKSLNNITLAIKTKP